MNTPLEGSMYTPLVVPTTLLGASHGYFETYQIAEPVEAVSAKLMETIPAEFPTELVSISFADTASAGAAIQYISK